MAWNRHVQTIILKKYHVEVLKGYFKKISFCLNSPENGFYDNVQNSLIQQMCTFLQKQYALYLTIKNNYLIAILKNFVIF